MKTITFYSYKGGTGRSLALANAARYLARLEFRVVVVDFDLEAPGLHYKFSLNPAGEPLAVREGIVDYLHNFIVKGEAPKSLKKVALDVSVPGIDKPLIHLLPAGRVPSSSYFSKLAQINWHELFYSEDARGVPLFLELKNQILDEFAPDFLLIDSRTGITEMGGAATTLLADKVICVVAPTLENLDGARAVLRSFKKLQRETGSQELEVTIAVGRLPETERERDVVERIRSTLNEPADDPRDTLACSEIYVLHSELALQFRESLRVGGEISPDDSVLLRDYLRLFANVVPPGLVESKVGNLIEQAKRKIWDDPEAALKEVEELAESFGHPEIYRALLRFYEVRNVRGTSALIRAQRLWELTQDSNDPIVWQVVKKSFDPSERWRSRADWRPRTEFLVAVWRGAGNRDLEFAEKLVASLVASEKEGKAADILLEVIDDAAPAAGLVARCIQLLDNSKRTGEAESLLQRMKPKLVNEPLFVEAWARHTLRANVGEVDKELLSSPTVDLLVSANPATAARLYLKAGRHDQAAMLAEPVLMTLGRKSSAQTPQEVYELAEFFATIGRWEDFESSALPVLTALYPSSFVEELRARYRSRPKRR